MLAPLALERTRILSPLFAGATLLFAVAHEQVGFPLAPLSFAIDVTLAVALAAIAVAAWRRVVPEQRGHLALHATWWLMTAATLQGFVLGRDPNLTLLLMLECIVASVLLQTRFVIVSFAILDAVYLPTLIGTVPQWHAYAAGTLGAQVLALAFQRNFRSAQLGVEQRRRDQAETAANLQSKLAELVRSREDREALSAQLASSLRMEATGTVAASFAHQMNNILAGITITASLLSRRMPQPDYDVILAESQRGAELTRALLAFSRRAPSKHTPRVFDEVVRTGSEMMSRTLPRGVQLELRCSASALVRCDAVQIGQLLVNLVLNASAAMDGRGTVTIETAVDGNRVTLRVRDHGHGMDETTRARVFDPFFTTKLLGQGAGLGMSTAWNIVRDHDGTIEVASEVGAGTTVTVTLPAHEETA